MGLCDCTRKAEPARTHLFVTIFLFYLYYLFTFGCAGSLWPLGLFSSCSEPWRAGSSLQRLLLLWSAGSRACGLQQLGPKGSVLVVSGLQSTSPVAVAHGLSCSEACGSFPDQGSNLCPALAGGLFTTEREGSAHLCVLIPRAAPGSEEETLG